MQSVSSRISLLLLLENWHKRSSALSISSPVVNEEAIGGQFV